MSRQRSSSARGGWSLTRILTAGGQSTGHLLLYEMKVVLHCSPGPLFVEDGHSHPRPAATALPCQIRCFERASSQRLRELIEGTKLPANMSPRDEHLQQLPLLGPATRV